MSHNSVEFINVRGRKVSIGDTIKKTYYSTGNEYIIAKVSGFKTEFHQIMLEDVYFYDNGKFVYRHENGGASYVLESFEDLIVVEDGMLVELI